MREMTLRLHSAGEDWTLGGGEGGAPVLARSPRYPRLVLDFRDLSEAFDALLAREAGALRESSRAPSLVPRSRWSESATPLTEGVSP